MTSSVWVLDFSDYLCSGLSPQHSPVLPFLSLCSFSAVLFLVLNYSPAMQTMMPSFSKDDCVCSLFCLGLQDGKTAQVTETRAVLVRNHFRKRLAFGMPSATKRTGLARLGHTASDLLGQGVSPLVTIFRPEPFFFVFRSFKNRFVLFGFGYGLNDRNWSFSSQEQI